MTTLYLVSKYDYDSASVLGIFSDKGMADKLVEIEADALAEEYVLDDPELIKAIHDGICSFYVAMDKNGEVADIHKVGLVVGRVREVLDVEKAFFGMKYAADPLRRGKTMQVFTLIALPEAKSEEDAIAIMDDYRLRILAAGKWPNSQKE